MRLTCIHLIFMGNAFLIEIKISLSQLSKETRNFAFDSYTNMYNLNTREEYLLESSANFKKLCQEETAFSILLFYSPITLQYFFSFCKRL